MSKAKSVERPLLILDLDETLIHAVPGGKMRPKVDAFMIAGYVVYRRPGLAEFIKFCFKQFQVGVWTSSSKDYCGAILEEIAPDQAFEFVWARERCTRRFDPELQEPYYHKTLKKLLVRGFNKDRILAIDDSPEKWEDSYGNLIRVSEFTGSPEDNELPQLQTYLETIRDEPKFRTLEKRSWRNHVR